LCNKAEIEELDSGTEADPGDSQMVIKYCALMTLIGGAQMVAVILSMNFQWPNNLTHAFRAAIGPIVFFNFIGGWLCAWLYAWLHEWLYTWLRSSSEMPRRGSAF
jgi:hypothetical protein